ncbi:MAG: hypothetical protein ACYSW8_19040 [Planctomycetota bacterium]
MGIDLASMFGTWKLALIGDPDDGSVVRAYAAHWKGAPDARWNSIVQEITDRGWKMNSTDNDNVASSYNGDNWTRQQVLADITRKPFALKRVPVPRTGLYDVDDVEA